MKISRGPRQGRPTPRETAVCGARGFLAHVLENPFETSAHFFQLFFLVMQLYTVEYSSHELGFLQKLFMDPIYLVAHVDLRRGSLALEGASVSHILDRNACILYTKSIYLFYCRFPS